MLVLTRKREESICIGDDIEILVSAIQGDKVKLAIKAPKDVSATIKAIYKRENV